MAITNSEFPAFNDQETTVYSINFDITSNRYEGHKLKSGIRVVYNDAIGADDFVFYA